MGQRALHRVVSSTWMCLISLKRNMRYLYTHKTTKYCMANSFVRISCDIYCDPEKSHWYRLYINDEMFVERGLTIDAYTAIRETVALHARPGRYLLWACSEHRNKIAVRNLCVLTGSAQIESDQYVVIA